MKCNRELKTSSHNSKENQIQRNAIILYEERDKDRTIGKLGNRKYIFKCMIIFRGMIFSTRRDRDCTIGKLGNRKYIIFKCMIIFKLKREIRFKFLLNC